MIQRVQTVYMILAAAQLVGLLGSAWSQLPVITVVGTSAAAAAILVAVFAFSRRALQLRIVLLSQYAVTLAAAVWYWQMYRADTFAIQTGDGVDWGRLLVVVMPAVAYALLILARRGIARDIATVESMDRML